MQSTSANYSLCAVCNYSFTPFFSRALSSSSSQVQELNSRPPFFFIFFFLFLGVARPVNGRFSHARPCFAKHTPLRMDNASAILLLVPFPSRSDSIFFILVSLARTNTRRFIKSVLPRFTFGVVRHGCQTSHHGSPAFTNYINRSAAFPFFLIPFHLFPFISLSFTLPLLLCESSGQSLDLYLAQPLNFPPPPSHQPLSTK